jgi:hypothetical protein
VRLRLVAKRLSEEAAQRAHQKRKAKARKMGRKNQTLTVQVADWLLVLTSLAEEEWSTEQVLLLYRERLADRTALSTHQAVGTPASLAEPSSGKQSRRARRLAGGLDPPRAASPLGAAGPLAAGVRLS